MIGWHIYELIRLVFLLLGLRGTDKTHLSYIFTNVLREMEEELKEVESMNVADTKVSATSVQ